MNEWMYEWMNEFIQWLYNGASTAYSQQRQDTKEMTLPGQFRSSIPQSNRQTDRQTPVRTSYFKDDVEVEGSNLTRGTSRPTKPFTLQGRRIGSSLLWGRRRRGDKCRCPEAYFSAYGTRLYLFPLPQKNPKALHDGDMATRTTSWICRTEWSIRTRI